MITRLVMPFLCCAPLLAGAADWLPVFRAPSGVEYSIDKAALVVISGDDRMIEAWDKETLPHPQGWTPPHLRGWSLPHLRGWMQFDDELINNARRLVLHDCERHQIEIIRFEVYFNDWWVDEVEDAQYRLASLPYGSRWLAAPPYLLPGSGGEAIHKAVCELGANLRM